MNPKALFQIERSSNSLKGTFMADAIKKKLGVNIVNGGERILEKGRCDMNKARGLWREKREIPPYEWVEGLLTYTDFDPVQYAAEITVEGGANYSVDPLNPRRVYGLARQERKAHFRGGCIKIWRIRTLYCLLE